MTEDFSHEMAAITRALDDAGHPWVAAENAITRMSAEDRAKRLGVPLPDPATRAQLDQRAARVRSDLTRAVRSAAEAALPAAFDLNDVGGVSYVAGVRDQGSCGSCVAFGSVAVLEGTARYTRRTPSLDVDLSEAHLFYGWGASVGRTCDSGWLPTPALTFCCDRGVTYESEWAYTPGNSGGGSLPADWEQHRARATGLVDRTSDVAAIKAHLTQYGPVTGCFVVYTDFFSYSSGVYEYQTGREEGGHCVAIVGFDDAQQAWIIKNSWGTSWGMGGFGLIKYGQCYIDTWSNVAVASVALRTWTDPRKVIGAYSTGHDNNGWVYVQDVGWLHVGGSGVSHVAMFADLLTAKEKAAYVNAYSDDGTITQAYCF